MASLAQIRTAVASACSTVTGKQASAYLLMNPSAPWIDVYPAQVEYHRAMSNGLDQWTLTVRAGVGLTTDRAAQVTLDEMLAESGSASVKAAIESSPTLGGVVEDVFVRSAGGYRIYQTAGGEVLGCEWTVDVLA